MKSQIKLVYAIQVPDVIYTELKVVAYLGVTYTMFTGQQDKYGHLWRIKLSD